jgi:hypothetical protein
MDSSQVADLWPTCWLCKLMQIVTPNCDILWHHVTSCGSNCHQMSPRYLKYCQWVHEPASHIATVQIFCNSINWEVQPMNGPKKHMPISVSFVKSLCSKIVWPNLPFHIHHRGDEHESRWPKFFLKLVCSAQIIKIWQPFSRQGHCSERRRGTCTSLKAKAKGSCMFLSHLVPGSLHTRVRQDDHIMFSFWSSHPFLLILA